MSNELKVLQYDEFKAKLDEVKNTCDFLPDVSTDEGYQKSKRVSLDVGKILTALEKTRKDLKADALEYGRKIDGEAKSISAELIAFQEPHKEAYKQLDNAKKEREAKRKADIEDRVRSIRELPELMRESDSDGIKCALQSMIDEECLDFFEYTDQALKARNSSKDKLAKMYADKLKQEADARELEELRKAQAEQAQKDHDARAAKEAEDRAKAEAAEREKEIEAEKQAAIKAAEDAAREAGEQKARAEREAVEAKERAELEKRKAVEAERERQEAEKLRERQEAEAREANKRHVGAIRKSAKEALMKGGITEKQAKDIVLAIHNGEIPNVSISY